MVLQVGGHIDGSSLEARSKEFAERDSRTPDRRGHKDRELGVEQPSETAPECAPGGGQDDTDVHDLVQSGGSRSECQCSSHTTDRVDHHQSRTEAGSTVLSGAPPLWSISRRGQPNFSLPSRPSWNPSPLCMPNTRSAFTLYLIPFSDNRIRRTLSLLGIRLGYFALVLLHWGNSLSSPQVMRRKQSSVNNC